jgi:hypothetical protein
MSYTFKQHFRVQFYGTISKVERAIHQGPSGPSGSSTGHPSETHTGSRPSIAAGAAGFPVSFTEVLAPAGWAGCEYIESMNRTENKPVLRYCGMLFIKCPLYTCLIRSPMRPKKKRGTSSSAFFRSPSGIQDSMRSPRGRREPHSSPTFFRSPIWRAFIPPWRRSLRHERRL